MTIRIGDITFRHASYDAFGDVLYLRRSAGQGGIGHGDTPEGHAFLYPTEDSSEIVGLDLHNASYLLQEEGGLFVTMPSGDRVRAESAESLVA